MIQSYRTALRRLAVAAAGALMAAGAASAFAQGKIPDAARGLIDAAKKEGALTVFGLTVNPSQRKAYAEAFSKFYGFDIDLKMISGLHPAKVAEIVRATAQGVPSGIDVFWTSATGAGDLERAGALEKVDWVKEVGADPALKWGPYGLRAQDGTLVVVTYNTQLVPADKVPHTYFDLLDPVFKGRIAVPRAPGIFVFLSYYLGEDKTAEFVKGLMENARLLRRFPDVRTRLVSGEFAIGLGADVFRERRMGAPVDFAPVEPVIVTPWASHVMKDAEHPNAAKLWGYFLTQPEGQEVMDKTRGIARVDAEGTEMAKYTKGKKVVVVPADFTQRESARLSAKFGKVMGLTR